METTSTTNTTKCHTCQVGERMFSDDMAVRETVTQAERNSWAMWGCTCEMTSDEATEMADEFARMHD